MGCSMDSENIEACSLAEHVLPWENAFDSCVRECCVHVLGEVGDVHPCCFDKIA